MKKITEISLKTFYCDAAKWFNEMFFATCEKQAYVYQLNHFDGANFLKLM